MENNFHSPEFQEHVFTSDYDRVGPWLRGNTIYDYSNNGLLVRIDTPTAEDLKRLEVAGRWDATELVHILQENLVIDSTPGGPFKETDAPSLELVSVSRWYEDSATLLPGTYNYRIVFVDSHGNEGVASNVSRSIQLVGTDNAVKLQQLPLPNGDFVARRIYRNDPSATSGFRLIAQVNQYDTQFVDNGTTLDAELDDSE